MERYLNLGGDSNVASYEIVPGSITVQFRDGVNYLYTDQSTSSENVAKMHNLATAGKGLNSFISRIVQKGFSRKWR